MASDKNVRLSKFRLRLITGTVEERAKFLAYYYGITFFVIQILVAIIISHHLYIISIVTSVVIGLAFGLFYYRLSLRFLTRFEEQRTELIGKRLDDDEIIALALWYAKGLKPTEKNLQPYLPKYLDFLEQRLNGSLRHPSTTSKAYRGFSLFFGLFMLFNATVLLLSPTEHHNYFLIAFAYVIGLLITASFFTKNGKKQSLFAFLNTFQLRKVARMRTQL